MNQIQTEAVKELTNSALQFSEAASDLGALKVIFGLFLAMVLVMFITYIISDHTYKRKVTDMGESVEQITRYFDSTAQLYLNKMRASQLVKGAYKSIAVFVKFEVLKARISHNEEETIKNAHNLASYIMYHFQSSFEGIRTYGGTLTSKIEIKADVVADLIVKYCSMDESVFDVGDMDRDVDLLVQGYEQQVSISFDTGSI